MSVERTDNGPLVRCDECGEGMPSISDIIINRGLNRMGWKCEGGTHLCPAHNPDTDRSGPYWGDERRATG